MRRSTMEEENFDREEQGQATPIEGKCNKEQALLTMRLLEKGTRQGFLDGELGVEETQARLDSIREARERCEAGDVNACLVMSDLLAGLTQEPEE